MVVRPARRATRTLRRTSVILAVLALLASGVAAASVHGSPMAGQSSPVSTANHPAATPPNVPRVRDVPTSSARVFVPGFSSTSVGRVTRTIFPGYNTSLPGSFTSSVGTWVVGTPVYVPTTDSIWFPQRAVAVPGDPTPTVAPIAVFNLTTGGFDRLVTNVSNASALAYDPGNGEVYATISTSDSVEVVNPVTGALVGSPVAVGASPAALAFDPNDNRLFVANSGSSNLTVIDTLDNSISDANVTVGIDPVSLAFDSEDNLVFVANAGTKVVSVVNATEPAGVVNSIKIFYGPTSGIAYSKKSGNLVATNPESNYATILNGSSQGVVTSVDVGPGMQSTAASENGTEFAISNSSGTDVVILNATNGDQVGSNVIVPPNATELILDPVSGHIYCWSSEARIVESLNLSSETAVALTTSTLPEPVSVSESATVGEVYAATESESLVYRIQPSQSISSTSLFVTPYPPLSILPSPTSDLIYVGTTDGLFLYNGSSGQLNSTVSALTGSCDQLAIDRMNNLLWLENSLLGIVAINLTTLRVVISTGITTPAGVAEGIAIDGADSETFVLESMSEIDVLDSHTGGVITSGIAVGSNVTSLVFDPADDQIYAAGDGVALVSGVTLKVDGGVDPFGGPHTVLGAVYDPSREAVFVSSVGTLPDRQGTVTVIDGSSVSAVENATVQIPVGEDPTSLAVVSSSGNVSGLSMVWVANELSGTISVLSTPPQITYFAATPTPVDLGHATSIVVAFSGGAGVLTATYSGLPLGCASSNRLEWNCTPTAAGVYLIGVNITDSLGTSTNATTSLTVLRALVVGTTFEPSTLPEIDVGIPFVGSASVSDGLAPYSVSWSFGDGSFAVGTNVSHAFSAPGAYAVVVEVSDATGASVNASTAVTVVPRPSVGISLEPGTTTDVDFPVSFVPTIVGGTGAASERWQFGDGTEASVANATHAWTRAGNYTVTFRYVDELGVTANYSLNVTVHSSLAASFSSGNVSAGNPAAPGTPVPFSSTISGGTPPYRVAWSFGDGSMAAGASVAHSYAGAGTYVVGVNLTDAVGATVRTNLTVVVATPSASSGGITSLGGGFATGLFVGLIVGGVLAAVVLSIAGSRKGERLPPTPGPPYVPP